MASGLAFEDLNHSFANQPRFFDIDAEEMLTASPRVKKKRTSRDIMKFFVKAEEKVKAFEDIPVEPIGRIKIEAPPQIEVSHTKVTPLRIMLPDGLPLRYQS